MIGPALRALFRFVDSLPTSTAWPGHDQPGPSDHPKHYGRNPGGRTWKGQEGRWMPRRAPDGKFLPNGATQGLRDAQSADDVEVCQ